MPIDVKYIFRDLRLLLVSLVLTLTRSSIFRLVFANVPASLLSTCAFSLVPAGSVSSSCWPRWVSLSWPRVS